MSQLHCREATHLILVVLDHERIKRQEAAQEDIEDDASTPNVAALAVSVASEDFGRHEVGRATPRHHPNTPCAPASVFVLSC